MITPDLSTSYNPQPKPHKKVKMPTPIKQVGNKTNEWIDAREILKAKFYVARIITCEIAFKDGCTKDNYLGFAHLAKRRKLTKEDLMSVVLACNHCHDEVEYWKAEDMKNYLQGVIDKRKVQI